MIHTSKISKISAHCLLLIAVLLFFFPIYFALVTSTQTAQSFLQGVSPLFFGKNFFHVYHAAFFGDPNLGILPAALLLFNTLVMALLIAFGKIALAILSAFSIVFFNFRFKKFCFWVIFLTLMLPVQVRIVPTYHIVVSLHLLNTMTGLTLPLIASATATFMFRQFFLTIPPELVEASQLDGASPIRFLWDILLPLSKTNLVAIFIIMFIYGWNQYLWPLIATGNDASLHTIVMSLQKLASVTDRIPPWNEIMAVVILATLPPIFIVVMLQRWFVKGLIELEK